MRTILPADTYKVYSKAIVENDKRRVLTTLYQPVIGIRAVSLYLMLLNDLNNNEMESNVLNHHHLITNMQMNLEDIVKAREKLEAIGLLKTYYKESSVNSYLYILYSPVSANEFLNHPILNVVLYSNVGKLEYENLVSKFRTSRINVKDYEDITLSFDSVFSTVNGYSFENKDIINDKSLKLKFDTNIDINLIVSGIPRKMTSDRCFNKESIELIIELAYLYKIDNLNMQGLVRNSINEKGMIDYKLLRESCRNSYQFENNGKLPTLIYSKQPDHLKEPEGNSSLSKMIYTFETVSPYDMLKSIYNNAEPTQRDKKMIENLIVEQKLNPGVVNVLIDYVLKINNKKLNKNLIEAIASNWKIANIETVREAMEICRKEHKKNSKTIIKINPKNNGENKVLVPSWFNSEIEINKDKEEELENILKEFD